MHHLASSNHLSNSWLQEALKIRGSINVGVGIICFPGQNRVITDLPKNWRGNYPPAPLLVYGTQILTLHTPNARPRRPFKKHQQHAFNPMRRKPFEHDCSNRSIVFTKNLYGKDRRRQLLYCVNLIRACKKVGIHRQKVCIP